MTPIALGGLSGKYLARPDFDDSAITNITARLEPYQDYFLEIQKSDVLMGGVESIRRNASRFLPTFMDTSSRKYEIFLQEVSLDTTYSGAIRDSAGRIFTRDIAVSDEVPPFWEEWRKDVDLKGTSFNRFAHQSLIDMLRYGITYVLVDSPANAGSGISPWLSHIKATQLLRLIYTTVNGIDILTKFVWQDTPDVIKEYVLEDNRAVLRMHERQTGTVNVSAINNAASGTYVLTDEVVTDYEQIPIIPLYAERHSFFFGTPPLKFLADKSLDITRKESMINLNLNYTLNPFIHLKGVGLDKNTADKKLKVSLDIALITDAETEAEWVSADPKMVLAAMQRVTEMKKEMQDFTLNFIGKKPSIMTAAEVEADNAKERTRLRNIVENLQHGFQNVMRFVADIQFTEWPDDGIGFNQELEVAAATAEHINVLLQLREAGIINRETVIKQIQRLNFFGDSEDLDALLAQVPDNDNDNDSATSDEEGDAT